MFLIKLIFFLSPIVLFLIKVFFPWFARGVYSSNGNLQLSKALKEEFFKLSIDYLFAAITYLLSKCIEYRLKVDELHAEIRKIQDTNLMKEKDALVEAFENKQDKAFGFALFFVAFLVIMVVLNDYAIRCGDIGKKTKKWIIIGFVFVASVVACGCSIYFY